VKYNVWIPGRFSLTNHMLSNLRAAGRWHGKRPRGWVDAFAQETKAIRMAAVAAIRKHGVEGKGDWWEPFGVWSLAFGVFGHHRHDPDAWYLLAKAICDGLADADFIEQDRSDVWGTEGRVLQSAAEERWWMDETDGPGARVPVEAGVMVTMMNFERPVRSGL
jgi:hypothetical protein